MRLTLAVSLIALTMALDATHGTLDLRYRAPRGIGYEQGYTTADLLVEHHGHRYQIMGNLRGHVFNDGKFAGNLGLGARRAFYDEKMLFGANVFYDVRQYHRRVFNQVGGGLELLIKDVDIRLNGYLPVGKKQSFDQKRFLAFSGSEIWIKQKIRGTLPCIELDFGAPIGRYFYLGAGPYYLFKNNTHGTHLGNRAGIKARLEVTIDNILLLGGTVSYDPIFKTRVQGYLSINIPLGKRSESTTPGRDLWNVPLVRNEIIPIQKKKRIRPLSSDSSGDNAIHVVFVNNQAPGPGDGTFAAPFSSLKAAEENSQPGDIIYVFPGDGTPRKMDEGIVLKQDQILASSGSPLEIADVIIPPATPDSHPVITNIHPDEPVITNPGASHLDDFYIFDSWDSYYDYFDEPAAVPVPQDTVVFGNPMIDDSNTLPLHVETAQDEEEQPAGLLPGVPFIPSPEGSDFSSFADADSESSEETPPPLPLLTESTLADLGAAIDENPDLLDHPALTDHDHWLYNGDFLDWLYGTPTTPPENDGGGAGSAAEGAATVEDDDFVHVVADSTAEGAATLDDDDYVDVTAEEDTESGGGSSSTWGWGWLTGR